MEGIESTTYVLAIAYEQARFQPRAVLHTISIEGDALTEKASRGEGEGGKENEWV
jgi:hypothetical protein